MVSPRTRVKYRRRLAMAIRMRLGMQHWKWNDYKMQMLEQVLGYNFFQDPDETAMRCEEVAACANDVQYHKRMRQWIQMMKPKSFVAYHLRNI